MPDNAQQAAQNVGWILRPYRTREKLYRVDSGNHPSHAYCAQPVGPKPVGACMRGNQENPLETDDMTCTDRMGSAYPVLFKEEQPFTLPRQLSEVGSTHKVGLVATTLHEWVHKRLLGIGYNLNAGRQQWILSCKGR